MRIRETYSLYKRKVPSGECVFYYRTYDEFGLRTCGHSTGQTSKTAAREFCNALLKAGNLVPGKRGRTFKNFKDYATDWWDMEKSEYLRERKERRAISPGYANIGKQIVANHLIPAFGQLKLEAITMDMVDTWLTSFRQGGYTVGEGEEAEQRHYKGNTGNAAFKVLRVMMSYAEKKKYIKHSPCKGVAMLLTTDEKVIKILTPDELKKLFPANWETVWSKRLFCSLNKLAAISGMRLGELLGLRGEYVFENYIEVCGQYTRFGYQDTKTHKPKIIPLPAAMRKELEYLLELNGEGYVFSNNGGESPVARRFVYAAFFKALANIGIDETERKRRSLSMHGWRHFLSTELEMNDIPDERAREVTGHASKESRKRYNHADHLRMRDVIRVQEQLLATGDESPASSPDVADTVNGAAS
jgi:integrase